MSESINSRRRFLGWGLGYYKYDIPEVLEARIQKGLEKECDRLLVVHVRIDDYLHVLLQK